MQMSVPFWLLAVSIHPVLACCASQTARDRGETISVEDLLEGHVRASGGRQAHARLHNRVTRGRAELRGFPDHDWTASFVRYEASPRIWSATGCDGGKYVPVATII